jgi:guanylate kinase
LQKGKKNNFSYKNNLAIIISSPSGAGKTTVTKKLISLFKGSYLSVSCTTRKKRFGEVNGKDYFFISKEKFAKYKSKKKFIEHAKVHNNYYGTLQSEVFRNLKKKKIVFFDVDWQGARVLKKKLKSFCYSIFLLPPTIGALKIRLLKRHKNNPEIAYQRFKFAKNDIIHFDEYDYLIVNKNLKKCVNNLYVKINELLRDKKMMLNANLLVKKMLNSK